MSIEKRIPRRKRVEEQLREERDKAQTYLDVANVIIVAIDSKGKVTLVNRRGCEILGYEAREIIGKDWFDHFLPARLRAEVRNVSHRILGGEIEKYRNYENPVVTKSGQERTIAWHTATLTDEAGDVIGHLSSGQDITERKRAEEALRESEENFRRSLDDSPLGIRIVSPEGETLYANRAILDIYGYASIEELKTTPREKSYTPESYAGHQIRKGKRQRGEYVPSDYEISIVRKDGEIRHLEVFRKEVLWDGKTQFQMLYRDITERKQSEEALRASEERRRAFMQSATESFSVFDSQLNYVDINERALKRYGLTREQVIGRNVTDIVPETKETGRYEKYLELIKTGQSLFIADVPAPAVFGADRRLSIRAFKVGDGMGMISTDITEQKRLEEAVRENEGRLKEAQALGRIGSWELDLATGKIDWSDEVYELYERDRALGPPSAEEEALYYAPEEAARLRKFARLATETGQELQYDLAAKLPSGKTVFFDAAVRPVTDNAGRVTKLFGTVHDITERKKMEEQLMAQDRLASIGQLVSGVAHEINNPLTGVIGFSELLLKRELPDDVKDDLKIVNDEARRAANVVKGLLAFARKQGAGKELVDVNGVMNGMLQLRAYEHRVSNIEVNTRLAADLPQVMANGAQLQQVFMNIIVNAEQAMLAAHGRGRLTIAAERAGDTVRVSFTDDGPGISPEDMGKLFTPFFTTKEVGKGTGLGLSICHGIVTEHGGRIYAESKPGKGATFIVELPVSR